MKEPGAILLVACYELGHQPLAVAWPAAFLEREGYAPAVMDVSVEPFDAERVRRAKLVAISVPMHTALRLGVAVAERVRTVNAACHIAFYGLYATLNADHLLAGVADSVMSGEIEASLVDLARSLERDGGAGIPAFYTPGGHRRFRRSDLEAFLAGPRSAPPAASPAVRASVLVVDDDPRLREFIRANLEAEGYAVREAGSADEGLAALAAEPPDLILLDVMMPKMDGWEMLRRVQERHGVDAIQVIMYSGKLDEAGKAAQHGAQAFIGKPFDPRKLLEATKQLLRS